MTTVVKDGTEQVTTRPGETYDDGSTAGRVRPPITRRHVQIGLGVLWLLDGLLQLQPYMFTSRFASQVIAPTATGQPGWVSWPVHHGAQVIGSHPVPADVVFAGVQLALGVGFLVRRTVRTAAVASVLWAIGVWFLGEGLGGLAGGTASFLTGGPGAAVLYAVLALAAWPAGSGTREDDRDDRPEPVASWFPLAWSAIWVDAALMTLLPANRSAAAVRSQLQLVATQTPGWLGRIDRWAIDGVSHLGGASVGLLVAVPALVGLAGLGPWRWRRWAAGLGIVVALFVWIVGEAFGQLASSSATDPNTGPLLVLCALALTGVTGWRWSLRPRIASRPDVISTPSGDVRLPVRPAA
jgi:hypothetical protein